MPLLQRGADSGYARAYVFASCGATLCAPAATWHSVTEFKYIMAISHTGVKNGWSGTVDAAPYLDPAIFALSSPTMRRISASTRK